MQTPELTLLAIDDQPDNLVALRALLKEAFPAARSLTATSGAQGVELACAEDPDVILLDIVMPGLDGFEVCRRLKAEAKTQDIPVVFVTALRDDRENRIKAIEAGAEAFLCKPIDETELRTVVRSMVKIKAASRSIQDEARRLSELVAERTRELEQSHAAALELVEELRSENAARRRSEAALQESEEKLRAVLDATPFPVAIVDRADDQILYWSRSAFDLFGHTAPTASGWYQLAYPDPDYRDEVIGRWKPFLERARRSRETVNTGEYRVTCRDGSVRLCELHATFLADRLIVTFNDITRRKQAQDRVKASEAYLSSIIDSIGDPVFVKDERFRFTLVNDALCTLLDKPRDEVIGTTGAEYLQAHEMELFLAVDREVLSSGVESECEEPLTDSKGHTRTLFTKKTRYVDPGGTRYIVGVVRDVTETKQLQAQAAQSDRLASMGMLAAGVAHEINNPLSYVLYSLESLTADLPKLSGALRRCSSVASERLGAEQWARLMGADGELLNPSMLEDILGRVQDALSGTARIRDIARGLGTFSRADDRRLVPVNLMHVIEVAINMVFNEIKYRSRLVKEYGAIAPIMANDGRLSQVFLNLLINAAHSIKDGDVDSNEIRVRTWQEGEEVFAEVRDTGTGIAAAHLPRLFQPFFTTKEIGVGTGLGLSISKNIIEGYGGRIEVTSKLGQGTRFVVRLPVRELEEAADAAVTTPDGADAVACGRVLIIDDEAGIRRVIARMLRDHEVVTATSGAEGRRVIEGDQAFDLILCDMMMPVLSGADLHEWLVTAHPELADRVIFITGGAFTPRARDYLNRVSNIRLEKPFNVVNFKKIVNDHIRLVQTARPG